MPPREDPATAPFWIEEIADTPGGLRMGLTESFLESLGAEGGAVSIVGLDLAPVGTRLAAGDGLGLLHLPDRAVDLRLPFGLTVLARNGAALADPRLVDESPYHRGWLVEAVPGGRSRPE